MADIKAVFTFELANGDTRKVTINDLADNLENSKLIALGNKMVTLGGEYRGIKFTSLKDCEKIVTSKEKLEI